MNGFLAVGRALVCAAVLIGAFALPASAAEPGGRMHDCGKLGTARFKVLGLGVQGPHCARARDLVGEWLARTTSMAGEGLPRSRRRGRWQCRRLLAWSCTLNGRDARMVVNFDLRRHGDLWPAIESATAVGPAGQAYVDYRIAIRNTGRDAVAGTLVNALPVNVTLVRATTTHGACAVEPGRLVCSLGLLGTGYDSGALVFLRVAYDCEA